MAFQVNLLVIVVLLLPMFYLLISSPAFLLVKLDIPEVGFLLRAQFFGYSLAVIVLGTLGVLAVGADGHLRQAVALAAVPAVALVWRRWFMQRMDDALVAREAGIPDAGSRLRRLHWVGMLSNIALLAAIVPFVPDFVATS